MDIIAASHLDHGLTENQIAFLRDRFADRRAFFIETVTLPEDLGTVPCGLYGPVMDDPPVPESEVIYEKRGTRPGASRLVARPVRPTRLVTVIAGPHEGAPCVLFTAFGGPAAEREPWDTSLDAAGRARAEAFWRDHALAL